MVAKLAESLRSHIRLHMLFLDNNKITEEGANHLADCLKNKQDLRVLNIDHNNIGPDGARSLAE